MAASLYAGNRRGDAALGEINITPLVDVMLVLLVIFMVTAPVASQVLPSRLPQAGPDRPEQAMPPVALMALPDGRYQVDGSVLDSAALGAALEDRFAEHPDRVLKVGASADADYQAFARALSAAREAGVVNIAQAP